MNKHFVILTVFVTCLLSACYEQPAPVVQAVPAVAPVQPAPVIVQQPTNDGFFTGLLVGHLMSGGGGYSHQTTIINKSYTNVTRNTYRPAYAAPRASHSYSSRSSFGSFRSGRR